MSAPVKVAGFLVALAAVFGAAIGIGSLLDPVAESATADTEHDTDDGAGHDDMAGGSDEHGDTHEASTSTDQEIPGGLMVSQAGYTLRLADPSVRPGRSVPVTFSILGPDGAVTDYDVEHEKQLHLIAVRRDVVGRRQGDLRGNLRRGRAGEWREDKKGEDEGRPWGSHWTAGHFTRGWHCFRTQNNLS